MFFVRSLGAVVGLVALVSSCDGVVPDDIPTSGRTEGPEAEARTHDPAALEVIEQVERAFAADGTPALPPPGLEVVRLDDGGLGARADAGARKADVRLPSAADAPFAVLDARSGLGLKAVLVGTRPVAGVVGGGYVVYPGGHASGDIIHRVTRDGTEDFIHVTALDAPPELQYDVELDEDVAGLRLYDGTLELLDEAGTPRLRMRAPHLTDADHRRHALTVDVEDCAYDTDPRPPWGRPVTAPGARHCTVVVAWDARAVRRPVLVDPAWSTTEAMVTPRNFYASARLSDGRVLLVGGGTAEIFDPDTLTFAAADSPTTTEDVHGYHAALTLGAGPTLYKTRNATYLYDPSNGMWSTTDAGSSRIDFREQMVALADGRVLLAGGADGVGAPTLSTEIYTYDAALGTGAWASADDLDSVARSGTAALLPNDNVLLVGGNLAQVYDPGLDMWSAASSPSVDFSFANSREMLVLPDGTVFLAITPVDFTPVQWATYDATGDSWSAAATITAEINFLTDALLRPDGTVLLVGQSSPVVQLAVTLDVATASETAHVAPAVMLNGEDLCTPVDAYRVLAAGPDGAELLRRGLGEACSSDLQCDSEHCVDGLCCDTACGGGDSLDCQACSVAMGASTDGTCAFLAATTACGDPTDTPCDNPDTCDGAGVCQPNFEPTTTSCGDAGVDCHGDDLCDGNGACVDGGFLPADTACGDTQATACSDPDVCDSAGRCLPSHKPSGTACGDQGVICHVDDTCNDSGVCVDNGFASAGSACGDATANECTAADTCDASGVCVANDVASGTPCTGGQCLDGSCSAIAASCGDGTVDSGEICDDGNNINGDGCAADCMSDETCGNGVVDAAAGEACDDGNTTDGDGCSATCALSSCGDGVVDAGEACDDGNTTDGDGCSANCLSDETCGNGIVDRGAGELCDEGADNGRGACSATCALSAPPPQTSGDDGCSVRPGPRRHDHGWLSLLALLAIIRRRKR